MKIKFFASAREAVGEKVIEREYEEGLTVEEVIEELMKEFSALEEYKNQIIIAVNKQTGLDHKKIENGDEIAILPPVSGG